MAKEKETSVMANDNSLNIDNEREQALGEREEQLNAREEYLNEYESRLTERELRLTERESQLDEREEALTAQAPEESQEEIPQEGVEFEFREVHYKFANDAPKILLIGSEALTQEQIAKDEDLLLQLIGGRSPLIVKL